MRKLEHHRNRHMGWNARHFYAWYRSGGANRSHTWVKSRLQEAGLIERTKKRGTHRKKCERAPLIVTMDDATSKHYSMFFIEEEGTMNSFQGVREVIEKHGSFASFYSDRGSHYWYTPEAGGKVDKRNLTRFGQAMKRLGIEMIAAYSPEACGRCERMFRTHQERLPKELVLAGIADMAAANQYLKEIHMPAFNAEFMQAACEEGSAFVPWIAGELADILCERHERVVGHDNCVGFESSKLQIPADRHRCHYVKAKVTVLRHPNGQMAIMHGPGKLATYDSSGKEMKLNNTVVA